MNEEKTTVEEKAEKAELAKASANMMMLNPYTDNAAFNDLFKKAQYLAKSDLVPDNYKNKPANCMIALDTANKLGVSPYFVMEQLTIVRGRRSWSGQACGSIINHYPKFKDSSVSSTLESSSFVSTIISSASSVLMMFSSASSPTVREQSRSTVNAPIS